MKVSTLARVINQYCHDFNYWWAYGLVKATIKLWENEFNYYLLCTDARWMADNVFESIKRNANK